jgi:hypothetical protein
MGKALKFVAILVVVVLLITLLVTTLYYSNLVNDKDSKISALESQITSLTSANLKTQLNGTIVTNNNVLVKMFPEIPTTSVPYNSLWINGSITNTGQTAALNAGLYVAAYAPEGNLAINMTVPLTNAVYGTDSATQNFISSLPNYVVTIGGGIGRGYVPAGSLPLGHSGSLALGSLEVGHAANVILAIYYEGAVTNWTVTPVWTDIP